MKGLFVVIGILMLFIISILLSEIYFKHKYNYENFIVTLYNKDGNISKKWEGDIAIIYLGEKGIVFKPKKCKEITIKDNFIIQRKVNDN